MVAKARGVKAASLRKQVRKTIPVNELYGGGVNGKLLQGRFGTEKVYAWFQNRHRRGTKLIEDGVFRSLKKTQFGDDHSWRVPASVVTCLSERLTPGQMNVQQPWYVTWVSPKTKERMKKRFASPWFAIEFIATKAQYVDPHASLVSRTRAYNVPAKYRGKFPVRQPHNGKTRTWYWCPLCMQPRRFRAVLPLQDFFAMVKAWSETKERYEWKDRKLRLLECTYCGCTNRDTTFRRSNQPWEVRKFKRGARRAKRRR